jgi:hypothetical protein
LGNLHQTYTNIKQILKLNAEPWESVELVDTYRQYLKPKKVRVILLAESHVFTSDADRQIGIRPISGLPGYPMQYARFVYCLGYGEKLLRNGQPYPKRDGTPQFWKILISCNSDPAIPLIDFNRILGQTPPAQRLQNKIKLLNDLKAKGVWLVDASVVALYKEGMKIPDMFAALEESWRSYTRGVVISSDPDHVICVGKGVASVVGSDLKRAFPHKHTIIEQPNARLSSARHLENFKMYSRICS